MFSIIDIFVGHGDLVIRSGFGLEIYLDLRWILYGTLAVVFLRARKIHKKNKRGF